MGLASFAPVKSSQDEFLVSETPETVTSTSILPNLKYLLVGVVFGVVFVKAGIIS